MLADTKRSLVLFVTGKIKESGEYLFHPSLNCFNFKLSQQPAVFSQTRIVSASQYRETEQNAIGRKGPNQASFTRLGKRKGSTCKTRLSFSPAQARGDSAEEIKNVFFYSSLIAMCRTSCEKTKWTSSGVVQTRLGTSHECQHDQRDKKKRDKNSCRI